MKSNQIFYRIKTPYLDCFFHFLKTIVIMAQNKNPIAVNIYVSSPVTYRFFWFDLNKN